MKYAIAALRSILFGGSDSTEAALQKVVAQRDDAVYLLGAIRALEKGDTDTAAEHLQTYVNELKSNEQDH